MAQGQVHLATPEALLSMTDKASGCREVQGAKGRVELRLFMLGCWQSHTLEAGTMLLDRQRQRARQGQSLLAGRIHPSLLGLACTNCPKIIRLVSGRTPLMSKGRVCTEIVVIYFGFLLTGVWRISKKAQKGKNKHWEASSLPLWSGCLDTSLSHFHKRNEIFICSDADRETEFYVLESAG